MRILATLILLFNPLSLHAQQRPLKYERFNSYFSTRFATEFVDEYNALNTEQFRGVYQYLFPKKYRDVFLGQWKDRPMARAEGSTVIFKFPDKAEIRIDIVDLLEQKYKINGVQYVHDWNGDVRLQQEMFMRAIKAQPKQASYTPPWVGLLMPEAHAFIQFIAAWLCVDGGCEAAAAASAALWGRLSIFVAENGAEIAAGARTVGTKAFRVAVPVVKQGASKSWETLKWIAADLYTSPAVNKGVKFAVIPLKWIYVGGKGVLKNPYVQSGVSTLTALTINNYAAEAAKKGISFRTSLTCIFTGKSVDDCNKSDPKIEVAASPSLALPKDFWCPTATVNEAQYVVTNKDGNDVVVSIHTTYSDKDARSAPVSGMRFERSPNGLVDSSSIVYFDMQEDKVYRIIQPQFGHAHAEISAADLVINMKDGEQTKESNADALDKIARRNTLLKKYEIGRSTVIEGDALKNYTSDPVKIASDPEAAKLDGYVKIARQIDSALTEVEKPICSLNADQAKTEKSAAAAATDTTGASGASK